MLGLIKRWKMIYLACRKYLSMTNVQSWLWCPIAWCKFPIGYVKICSNAWDMLKIWILIQTRGFCWSVQSTPPCGIRFGFLCYSLFSLSSVDGCSKCAPLIKHHISILNLEPVSLILHQSSAWHVRMWLSYLKQAGKLLFAWKLNLKLFFIFLFIRIQFFTDVLLGAFSWWWNTISSTNFTLQSIFFRSDSSTKSFGGISNYIRTN